MSSPIEGIAPALQKLQLNEQQRAIVAHKQGPLRVIAGPGTGKTRSLTLLAMNLILCGDAAPSEIILCTYTEKAAFELQDRLARIAKEVDYTDDLSSMRIGTIHSICQQLINQYLHRSPLGNDYETLARFTQQLFIFEHLRRLCPKDAADVFQKRLGMGWSRAEKLAKAFNTIAEELIFDDLKDQYRQKPCPSPPQEAFLYHLTYAYACYQRLLIQNNCLDFAHLESCAYKLLQEPDIREKVTSGIRYVLVDEYQDTNYIQEQLLSLLASGCKPKNLVVIGDEDQALYRFRGATVDNILAFDRAYPEGQTISLTTNYRSHPKIIQVYNEWMSSFDWPIVNDKPIRTEKNIGVPPGKHSNTLSVLSIQSPDDIGEARQFADLVLWLKEREVIKDFSEVALLLHSAKHRTSKTFIEALDEQEIPYYCPRARTFFRAPEIGLLVGCFARILGYEEEDQAALFDETSYPAYIADCQKLLAERCRKLSMLEQCLLTMEQEIQVLITKPGEISQQRLADYYYRLLPVEPFVSFLNREEQCPNLVVFSRLLRAFQRQYHYDKITAENLRRLQKDFFSKFLHFLRMEEAYLDEYRENEPLPKGCVPILTIHAAKGLEFPVVVVSCPDAPPSNSREDDYGLSPFFHHSSCEPRERISEIDRRRLYYVALSRAQHVLVCSSSKKADQDFDFVGKCAATWPFANLNLVRIPAYAPKEEAEPPNPRYGFTSHIQTYTICPRRYQFLYDFQFRPSLSHKLPFGLLVHQTIERIHRFARDGMFSEFAEDRMRELFDKTYTFLLCSHIHPLDEDEKDRAFRIVSNYVTSNQREMECIADTELSFRVDQNGYVLVGQIDLIRQGQDGLEIVDFKSTPRQDDTTCLEMYRQQLHLYAYALKRRTGTLPGKLFLYWMGEERKERALMEVPCRERDVQESLHSINTVVEQIQEQKFNVIHPPGPETCRDCDVRHLCRKERIIL
jgi:DNA helicase-2/ATP-dependent DNA helicase PcrA